MALFLHGLHIFQGLLGSRILLFFHLNYPGTEGLLLILMRLTLRFQLSPIEFKLSLQSTHLRRQLFLVLKREKEAGMIMRKRPSKKREKNKT